MLRGGKEEEKNGDSFAKGDINGNRGLGYFKVSSFVGIRSSVGVLRARQLLLQKLRRKSFGSIYGLLRSSRIVCTCRKTFGSRRIRG